MRDALVDAVVALDEVREALGRIPLGDVTDAQREQAAEVRKDVSVLRDQLRVKLDGEEHDHLDDVAAETPAADTTTGDVSTPVPMGSVRDFYEGADVDAMNTVACGEWPAFDGSEWPSQTFLGGRLRQLLDSPTVDGEHVLSGPVRVSLPEFETNDADSGTVIAVETTDGEVAVACPWTGDFDVDESEVDR